MHTPRTSTTGIDPSPWRRRLGRWLAACLAALRRIDPAVEVELGWRGRASRWRALSGTLSAVREQDFDHAIANRETWLTGPTHVRLVQRSADGAAWLGLRLTASAAGRAAVLAEQLRRRWPRWRRELTALLREGRMLRRQHRLERAARLQRALYAIAELASSDIEQSDLLSGLHRIVGQLMYAENFFIVQYDAVRRTMRFAYFADSVDREKPSGESEPEAVWQNTLTMAMIRRGTPLMGPSERLSREIGLPDDGTAGPESADWLGVPLIAHGIVHGAVVVQSYDPGKRFREADRTLLIYVAQHILAAMRRHEAQAQLEASVEVRTQQLAAANLRLSDEVEERKRGERLQASLYRIAELTSTSADLEEFFTAVHAVIGELVYARNFFVVLLVDEGRALDFPYASDEHDPRSFFQRRGLRNGLTELVLRAGRTVRADRAEIDRWRNEGRIQSVGTPSISWMGIPLTIDGRVAGALVVQSYREDVVYSEADQDLLTFVAFHIATALQRRQAQESLRAANAELAARLEQLSRAQSELIETEKMASLGRLVAGVAHEVNTPLGVSITALSFLNDQLAGLRRRIGESVEPALFESIAAAEKMAETNVERAAKLVRNFKEVAVDQSLSSIRPVRVADYLDGTLASLHPLLRKTPHQVELDCAADLELTNRPDALYQVVVNLVMNSLHHAFPDGRKGRITLAVRAAAGRVHIDYRDDGVGMDPEVASHLFEPFYTTRRAEGGTGLGMHIVYNLVTQALAGRIRCDTAPGRGVHFEIDVPQEHPATTRAVAASS